MNDKAVEHYKKAVSNRSRPLASRRAFLEAERNANAKFPIDRVP